MSSYSDSQSESFSNNSEAPPRKMFQYDYYLSNSFDVFQEWSHSLISFNKQNANRQTGPEENITMKGCRSQSKEAATRKAKKEKQSLKLRDYLRREFLVVKKVSSIRTACLIRSNAFIFKLHEALKNILHRYHIFFGTRSPSSSSSSGKVSQQQEQNNTNQMQMQEHNKNIQIRQTQKRQTEDNQKIQIAQSIENQSNYNKSAQLDEQLIELLQYLEIIVERNLVSYYEQIHGDFSADLFSLLEEVFMYVVGVYPIWRILTCLFQINPINSSGPLLISLGGNMAYYKNIIRSMAKKNYRLKQLVEKATRQVQNVEKVISDKDSTIIIQIIRSIQSQSLTSKLENRQKWNLASAFKGLYFERKQLHKKDTFHQFLFASLHINHLDNSKKYVDHEYFQNLFERVLIGSLESSELIKISLYLEVWFIPFEKRKKAPKLELTAIEMAYNFIGCLKNQTKVKGFKHVPNLEMSNAYPSTFFLANPNKLGLLILLLVQMQGQSKAAFAGGGVQVHKAYLDMSKMLKEMYLSFVEDQWLLPSQILSSLYLKFFLKISEDVKAEVKKAMYHMVNELNQGRMPMQISIQDGKIVRKQVGREEYLKVILYYLEDCSREEQYVNLPQVMPSNLQTGILYIKSLQLKLKMHEPNADQKPYYKLLLEECQKLKLNIKFRWFQAGQNGSDRDAQFSIEKELPEVFMQQSFRQALNLRDKQLCGILANRYKSKQNIGIIEIASILKYSRGLNILEDFSSLKINEGQIFVLLDQMTAILQINFGDLLQLSLEEKVSLNYLHICIGFYNITYKEAKGSPIYAFILEKIMVPYLRAGKKETAYFKEQYPIFFNKWIYVNLLEELFLCVGQMLEGASDPNNQQHLLSRLGIIFELVSDKDLLVRELSLQKIAQIVGGFSIMFQPEWLSSVYLSGVEIVAHFINCFPSLKDSFSLQFLLGPDLLQRKEFCLDAIEHVRKNFMEFSSYSQHKKVSILNSLLLCLPSYMGEVGLKTTLSVIKCYTDLRGTSSDWNIDELAKQFSAIPQQKDSEATLFLKYVFTLKTIYDNRDASKQMFQQKVQVSGSQQVPELERILQRFRKHDLQKSQTFEKIHFTEMPFLQQIVTQIQTEKEQQSGKLLHLTRQILSYILSSHGQNEDLIYFSSKLGMSQILSFEGVQGKIREEKLLIDLILENYHPEEQTDLIKQLLRQNRTLSDAASKAILKMMKNSTKIHTYHINRFIQINNRHPNSQIQDFLLLHIGKQRNKTATKIQQTFLVKDISKKISKLPNKLCEQILLKPLSEAEFSALQTQVNEIFQKLIYVPMKKFQKVNMVQAIQSVQEQEWNTDSQDETRPHNQQKTEKQKKKVAQWSGASEEQAQQIIQDVPDLGVEEQILDEEQDYNEEERPDFLQIFTQEGRKQQLVFYEDFMRVREQIDVYLKGDYRGLNQKLQNKFLVEKILTSVKILQNMTDGAFIHEIGIKMPRQLFDILVVYGLECQINVNDELKLAKSRSPNKNKPRFVEQFFSERQESEDSNASEDGLSLEEESEQHSQQQVQGQYDSLDSDNQSEDCFYVVPKKASKVQKNKMEIKSEIIEPPPMLFPTYSKIQEQISGAQFGRLELAKIMEIGIYQLLVLPHSQIRMKHITSFYLDILESKLGPMFLQSALTVLRFQQYPTSIEEHIKQSLKGRNDLQIGLQQVSLQTAIVNVLYLLNEYEEDIQRNQTQLKDKKIKKQSNGNLLLKQSGVVLPIAEQMLNKFDLPLQSNCLTLLLIYIANKKQRIRDKIVNASYTPFKDEQQNGKQFEQPLRPNQLQRVINAACLNRCNTKLWQIAEGSMGFKIKPMNKLFACIKGYGGALYTKLFEIGLKIISAIQQSEKQKNQEKEQAKLHSLQSTYHVVSKLLSACGDQVKQFYFINKQILRQLFNEQDEFQNGNELYKVPPVLIKHKKKILTDPDLIRLAELVLFFVKHLRDKFQGKIEDKLLHRLLHYPKMLIQTAWMYVSIFNKTSNFEWRSPAEVNIYFAENKLGQKQFKSLQQVCNLVLAFLDLESFCCDKFKDILLPIFMRHREIGIQAPLIFKTPKSFEDQMGQSILVTRKCSFDMAFYQFTGSKLVVEFHGEEGNDHGGLVRQLMMGWKGKGIGEEDFFLGKILGISFRQGVPYGGAMDLAMFVAITGYTPKIQFFKQADPQIYKSLAFIRDNDPSDLCLRFTIQKNIYGILTEFQMKAGGSQIQLSQSNKNQYIKLYAAKYYSFGRERQFQQLRTGFYSVVYPAYAQIFTPLEMLQQIRGEEVVDKKILKSKAKYEQGYSEQSPVIIWLWEIVQGFSQQQMNKFIQFVTGSPKITLYNSGFQICIQKVYNVDCLPVAHTCFNTLDLPEYSSRQVLEKKLLTAIFQGNDSFGIL